MSYIKPQITPPSPLIIAILNGGSNGGWIRRIWDHHVENPRKILAIWLGGWGGDTWVRFGLAHFLQRLIVFWWFLQTYMTSGPCSSWFFLVLKSWFFWCYLGLQVMAILCRAAKNSLRGTTVNLTWHYHVSECRSCRKGCLRHLTFSWNLVKRVSNVHHIWHSNVFLMQIW